MVDNTSGQSKMEHDFDPLTQYCKNCGVPRYAIEEFEIHCSSTSKNEEEK